MIQPATIEAIRQFEGTKTQIRIKKIQLDVYTETKATVSTKRQTKSYENMIEKIKCELIILEKAKKRYIRLLTNIRNGIEGPHFNVYYLHYVKNYSLGDTAKKSHYSKSGVCKILKEIMKRVDRK